MALLVTSDIKGEIDPESKMGSTFDTLLSVIASSVLSAWDKLTGRTWEEAGHTEYYNSEPGSGTIFLRNKPVNSGEDFEIYDDPDWSWPSTTLVVATDYRVDYSGGIVYYYGGSFHEGKQSLKVVYTAGYTSAILEAAIKQIWVRQASVWFKQAMGQEWHVSSKGNPVNAGSVSFRFLEDNYLPEFKRMAELST